MVSLTPTAPVTVEPKRNIFRADIQGLRAIAVLLVVAYHSGISIFTGGYIGVDVFFVISGFLITTHLLESFQREGKISLAFFYKNRARRILPAALVVIVLTVAASLIWIPPLQLEAVYFGAISSLLYVPNMLFAYQGTNYLAETAPSVFQHYWSLGIEEQFYLIWPLLIIVLFRFTKTERGVFIGAILMVVGSFALSLLVASVSQPWAFFSLPTRAWELGVGALVAFGIRAYRDRLACSRVGLLAWVGLAVLVLAAVTYDSSTPFPGYHALVPVGATALIIVGGVGRLGPVELLSTKPMQFIGLISYSLYLVHWPMLIIPQAAAGSNSPLPVWLSIGLGFLSVPVAYLLFRFVEDPIRGSISLKRASPRRTAFTVGLTTLLIVLATLTVMLFTERQDLHSGENYPVSAPTEEPAGTSFVPANLSPSLRSAAQDIPEIYNDGCHRDFPIEDASGCQFSTNSEAPRVVLFGDSHAASWFPALMEMVDRGEIRLDVNTKSSCHSADIPSMRGGVTYAACDAWRSDVIDRIRVEKPDLVLLANFGDNYVQVGDVSSVDEWTDGLARTIGALRDDSAVVVIEDVPNMVETPSICLSNRLDDADSCERPREYAINDHFAGAEEDVANELGAGHLDMTPYFCNFETCPPIVGNHLVYRDAHHLTASFSRHLGDPLARQIEPWVD